jgi:hypothetical protein
MRPWRLVVATFDGVHETGHRSVSIGQVADTGEFGIVGTPCRILTYPIFNPDLARPARLRAPPTFNKRSRNQRNTVA